MGRDRDRDSILEVSCPPRAWDNYVMLLALRSFGPPRAWEDYVMLCYGAPSNPWSQPARPGGAFSHCLSGAPSVSISITLR
jgi:hypothetical protein